MKEENKTCHNTPKIKKCCKTCRYYGENKQIDTDVKTVCANMINNLGDMDEIIYPFINFPDSYWCSLYYEIETMEKQV